MAKRIGQYEGMFLFPAGVGDSETAVNTVRGMIERHEGQIIVIKKWDERRLAYEIDGNKRGLYVLAFFRAPGDAVASIERDVQLSEEVLRCLVVKADHLSEEEMNAAEPQRAEERPPQPEGGDRFDRGDRGDRPPRRRREEESAGARE